MLISLVWRIILVHVVAKTTPIYYINKLININIAYTLYNCVGHDIEYLIICQLKLPRSLIQLLIFIPSQEMYTNIFKLKHDASSLNILSKKYFKM